MKRLISLLLCAAMLCTFAGCAEPVPETQPTEEPTQPIVEVTLEAESAPLKYAGVTLQFWSGMEETDAEAAVLRQAAELFEKTTGAAVTVTWQGGDRTALAEKLAAGEKIDIFEVPGGALQEGFLQYALDLTELARASGYEGRSWEVLRSQIISRCGSLRAIAYRPRLYGLYYNRDSFDALGIEATPASWADYLAFCQQLKDRDFEALSIDQERAHLLLELHMERALGWEGLKETMVNAQWRKNETAMTMIQEAIGFAEKGYVVKGTPDTYPDGQNRLAQSNATLVAGSSELCAEVEKVSMMDVNWGVFPYPGDGPGSGLLVDADVLLVSSACEAPEAAFDFVQLLTAGEFDQLRADLTEGIPADPANISPITGANTCMAAATAQAPRWFVPEENVLFSRLWNGYYKTGAYFAEQLNILSRNFESEKSVG